MLTADTSTPYLLENGLVAARSILDGDLTITSAARRNRNLRVTRKDGPGYLVKQPDELGSEGLHSLHLEAAFYAFCQEEPAVADLSALLPRMVHFDRPRALIALELLEDATPLWGYYSRFAPDDLPAPVMDLLGRALGTAHRVLGTPALRRDPRLGWMRSDVPWVMQVHKPDPTLLASISPANYNTLKILQTQGDLGRHLDDLRRLWRPESIIHDDIKSDNVLVVAPLSAEGSGPPDVKIIDWELVQIGDPAWDLAGLLQDFLLFWVLSMNGAAADPAVLTESARYPLSALQRCIRVTWSAYRETAALSPAEAGARLDRAVRFSAARLVQSAFEMAQQAMALPVASVLLLQIAANLLADPQTGQVKLYGLHQEGRLS
ncbi:phosphotransferase [Sorangium sp. So ce1389]|uniref:phosphotransferase n=1 Tax=Sorangium sp. So ce1389 TaxID=3133336 RepID=UPI003F64170D